jgi:Zn-finger nucleic acid-binding protein
MNPGCPACKSDTALTGWDDVYGFECQACRGHLIRSDSLNAFLTKHEQAQPYLEHLERVREAPASRRALCCPDCGVSAYRMLHTERVEIDACAGCGGLFCDAGEAAEFLDWTRSAPPPRRLPRTFAEKRRVDDEIIELMVRLLL